MGIELIKSITIALFFGVVAFIVLLAGYALGLGGSFIGMVIISFVFIGIQWYIGPWIVKVVTGCKPADRAQYPELWAMFEELSQKAGFSKPPELYIVNSPSPNAFAFGRTKSSSAVAVHTGLLEILNKEEIRGVLAHELGHIANGDNTIMTLASSLPIILYYFAYFFISGRDDREKTISTLLLSFVAAIVARLIGQLIVLWLSRAREYEADAFAKRLTGNPKALSAALAKITYTSALIPQQQSIEAMRSFYIASPSHDEQMLAQQVAAETRGSLDVDKLIKAMESESKSGILSWFSTHPPTVQRIRRLMAS